ncbi:MAG TPA: MT-A70 family methyltransferase [Puia sp.]|nr:MT-A70 family methyltransferase [Puia sp.]
METVKETNRRGLKYSVVYADVPWGEENWFLDRIRELPVINLVEENALLLLWVPASLVPQGLLVLGEWGFEYAGLLTWRKSPDRVERFPAHSICEYMLVGKLGSVQTDKVLRNMLYEGPETSASYKPQEFRSIFGGAGRYLFGELATFLDVFGKYWQGRYADYETEIWDFLYDE